MTMVLLQIYLEPEEKKQLKQLALDQDTTMTDLVRPKIQELLA